MQSANFMADALYCGRRFRTFNVIDDHNREALDIEIDTSITGLRLSRVFERLKAERGLPDVLRMDHGPEFLADSFTDWAEENGMMIRYIQPGEPYQNAYIERFNRTYRDEVLDLYLFRDVDEVRGITQLVADRLQRAASPRIAGRSAAHRVRLPRPEFSTFYRSVIRGEVTGYHEGSTLLRSSHVPAKPFRGSAR